MSWIDPYHVLSVVMDSMQQLVMNIVHVYQLMQFLELEWPQNKRSQGNVSVSTASLAAGKRFCDSFA